MADCGCCALRLGGKVTFLRRPVILSTLRRSPPECCTSMPHAARPRFVNSLPVAGISGRAARFKVTFLKRMCRMASAAADDLDRHGEEQASGHRSEGHGPNPVGHGVHWGALLQRVLATAALAAVTYCTVVAAGALVSWWEQRVSQPWESLVVLAALLIYAIPALKFYGCVLSYDFFLNWVLKHSVPPLYKYITQSHGATVAMVQLAVLDPQRHLQQQLLKIVTSAYISEPDPQHVILEDTTDLLISNRASIVHGYLEGTHPIVGSWVHTADFLYKYWCSRERITLRYSSACLEQRKAPSSLGRDTAMEGQQQLTVVTLLVTAKGMEPVPEQTTAQSIVDMLRRLPLVNKDSLISCQVLWTPVDKDTRYTSDDLARDYTMMKTFRS